MTDRAYKLNSEMPWTLMYDGVVLGKRFDMPEPYRPFIALVEKDTCDPTAYPCLLLLVFEPDAPPGQRYRLLDFDPEIQEEFLLQYLTIRAWRYLTDHAGTWDKYFEEHPEENDYLKVRKPDQNSE